MTMTNIDRAEEIISYANWSDECVVQGGPTEAAQDLSDAGLLATAPQIIRTVEKLEALHSSTVVWSREAGYLDVAQFMSRIESDPNWADDLPAVVVATGAQVRAAQKALEEA